jgi:hypothetical protein
MFKYEFGFTFIPAEDFMSEKELDEVEKILAEEKQKEWEDHIWSIL